MELKDVILSTIAELGEEPETSEKMSVRAAEGEAAREMEPVSGEPESSERIEGSENGTEPDDACDREAGEREFLENLRERLLVLFEGFQSPNNRRVEAKIDLTLNFLEYLLALLDERIDTLKKR
ncbi:hypothetical protein NNO_1277 [Hydrogenimonas sp.]|nr:hypothetical protein NNO_1277 [Hydrogenimonas sp.]